MGAERATGGIREVGLRRRVARKRITSGVGRSQSGFRNQTTAAAMTATLFRSQNCRAAAMPSQQPARHSTTLSRTFMPALA